MMEREVCKFFFVFPSVCHPRPLQLFLLSNHISVLDLSNVGLRALHAPPLFHALRGLGTLTSLNLSGNPLGDASLIHLTSCLHHLPSLTHLDLTCTRVTGQGLVASVVPTAPAESAWQHLLRLALAYNGLGGGGARGVAAVLRHCRSLQGLVLEGCGLTERDCDCHELPDALKGLGVPSVHTHTHTHTLHMTLTSSHPCSSERPVGTKHFTQFA